MVKYIDGSVEDCGERIEQEVVFGGKLRLKRLLEGNYSGIFLVIHCSKLDT